ncbi:alpha-amylase family glycosyl hydrolase [Fictibacillus phosphorivorans]|uniref:alpha-amylase family glycosyl hydrolase n=1 Tax=Fictibacillus phosphorivorans TaxID=1221500 RepID=UPI0020409D6F|nr:alpha-amylase family glycosyl hydrolase [Fictibacillus phosphorivorans]MCM3719076.1 alpha-amylase family glycosyl hydrolase [Fictibacillus phosphorivorans]MCM3776698.1 alpha-amylase family glycosyl hydrolase [Fictibacillus phosphorivorans]
MGKRFIFLAMSFLLFLSVQNKALAEKKEERSWKDETIYFIMIDRFHNGDKKNDFDVDPTDPSAYHGGDFKGITKKLDYLKDLGVTAIWMTPVVKNEERGYHGYWTEDFYETEEHFGTEEELKKLVQKAHDRDIKVIVDLVVNHTGYIHAWQNNTEKKDWFHPKQEITNWDDQQNVENGWLAGLPDLNTENPETRKYLLDMAEYWIKETNIDGYRLDTVKHVPKDFWVEFSERVKNVKSDFYLIGEVWHNDPRYISEYNKAGIQSFVDYPLFNEMVRVFRQSGQSLSELHSVWERNKYYYDDPYMLGNFIDNHDNIRFVREVLLKQEDPEKRLKMALTYLYTAPGIPILYQGTEHMVDGGKDPDNRRMMAFNQNKKIETFTAKLGSLRQKHPALRRGDFTMIKDEGAKGVFKRTYKGETLYIVFNNDKKAVNIAFQDKAFKGHKLVDLMNQNEERADGNKVEFQIKGETALIFLLQKHSNKPFLYGAIGAGILLVILLISFFFRKSKS